MCVCVKDDAAGRTNTLTYVNTKEYVNPGILKADSVDETAQGLCSSRGL